MTESSLLRPVLLRPPAREIRRFLRRVVEMFVALARCQPNRMNTVVNANVLSPGACRWPTMWPAISPAGAKVSTTWFRWRGWD